jgi:cell wall-associated NlpC family hydrolase
MAIRTFLVVFTLLFSSGTQAAEQADAFQSSNPIGTGQVLLKTLPDVIHNLLQYALNQNGASYRRGGTRPESGFDCSGFVRNVFDHVEGVLLPHSARAISLIGNRIRMTELQPGDLVFFRLMRHTVSHVGIYLGNNRFIHASSIRSGVKISNLSDGYWAKHFTLARRIGVSAEKM